MPTTCSRKTLAVILKDNNAVDNSMIYNKKYFGISLNLRQIIVTLSFFIISFAVKGQMGWNCCFFKLFIDTNKVMLLNDTSGYIFFNNHTDFKEIKYKGTWLCPDSCWSLVSDGSSFTGNYPEENVVHHPFLVIIDKTTNDTMKIHYNFLVYGFREGTQIPLINEILFTSGVFDVYEQVTKKDWLTYSASNKIKKTKK